MGTLTRLIKHLLYRARLEGKKTTLLTLWLPAIRLDKYPKQFPRALALYTLQLFNLTGRLVVM
jgi:hypothetical protein